jgi:hypothetical protein
MRSALRIANEVLTATKLDSLPATYHRLSQEEWLTCYIWDIIVFRGVGEAINQGRNGPVLTPASFDGRAQLGDRITKIYGVLSNDHFYSSSCSTLMTGRKRALMCGEMRLDENGDVEIHPIIIGDMRVRLGGGFDINWNDRLRLYPQQIDAFGNQDRVTAKDAKVMLSISEEQVKDAIASILGEPFVPKDWGGEKSDLSTARISVEGRPTSAAFILKGPSVPGPLHPANMGKRGDQLLRAFEEPVEIVVVQHCAKIENTVVRFAEALAANPSRPKRYCILDGADTYRLLRAHDKLPQGISN